MNLNIRIYIKLSYFLIYILLLWIGKTKNKITINNHQIKKISRSISPKKKLKVKDHRTQFISKLLKRNMRESMTTTIKTITTEGSSLDRNKNF